jgi:hypothetical protein
MSAEEYHVVYSGQVRKKLKEILRKAKIVGKLQRFAQAVVAMDKRLRGDPLGLGELTGTLKWLKLPLHVGFIRPLMIEFAVHEEKRIVFVRKIEEVTNIDL